MRIKFRFTRPWAVMLCLSYPRHSRLFVALSLIVTFLTVAFAFYFIVNFTLTTLHAPQNYFTDIKTTSWINWSFIGIFAGLAALQYFFRDRMTFAASLALDLCFLAFVFYLAFFVPIYTIFWQSSSAGVFTNVTIPPLS